MALGEKANVTFLYLAVGLTAWADSDWAYPYPETLMRARATLYGQMLRKGQTEAIQQSMSDFIRMLQMPLEDWWPYDEYPDGMDPDVPILIPGLELPYIIDDYLFLLDDLGGSLPNSKGLKLILDNRKMKDAIARVTKDENLQAAYVAFRRYLIENPWLDMANGLRVPSEVLQLMERVTDFYEMPSPNMLHDGQYWQCPRCKGLLTWVGDEPKCAKDGLCESLCDLRKAAPVVGDVRTLKMAFRLRVQLPGLPEIELYEELSKIPGATVHLWPEADRYDLLVEIPDKKPRLALDVKDYTRISLLEMHIRESGQPRVDKGTEFYYVIPNHRERLKPGYIDNLRRRLRDVPILLTSEVIRMAKG